MLSCNGDVRSKLAEDEIDGTDDATTVAITCKPGDSLVCGYLDKAGILWFGTQNQGLYRFDGSSFTNYSEKNGLCSNSVSCITEDNRGNLWLGTANGLCKFDKHVFTHIPLPKYDVTTGWLKETFPVVNPNEVQSILQDRNGIFWLGTNGAGAYRYDGKTFTNYLSEVGARMPDGLHHNIVQSIVEDKAGNIWFASMSHGGVSCFDGKSFRQFMPKDGLSDDMVRTCFKDKAGNIWFGFNGNRNSGLTVYNGKFFHTFSTKDGLCNTNIRGIYEDKRGNLWLGSGRGSLCIFDGKAFHSFASADGTVYSGIRFIIGDGKGNVWFGGRSGLWKFDGNETTDMTRID